MIKLPLKVIPGSSRECIPGWLDGTLKVRVRAKPENGEANRAVERMLAKVLGLQRGSVQISSGFSSARKTVVIEGIPEKELRQKLEAAILQSADSR